MSHITFSFLIMISRSHDNEIIFLNSHMKGWLIDRGQITCTSKPGHNCFHYDDVIMGTIASQITSLTIVYSTVYSGADQSKHQSSASLAFVWGIHRGLVNSPHKWPVTRKMFPFDDVIMTNRLTHCLKECGVVVIWILVNIFIAIWIKI